MIYRTDYHSHTKYSDGHGWPEDYIPFAIKRGISELGFSDHLTLTEEQQDWSIKPSQLGEYCDRILSLNKNNSNIKIKLGLEIDFLPGKEDDIKAIINSYPFDYTIGSIHYLDGESVDLGPEYYQNRDLESLYSIYFETVAQAASTGLFNIMGHIDLVRMFGYFPSADLSTLYRKLAKSLKKSNVTVEINTNGRNKVLNDFYPDPVYLNIFREEGVSVCVNSDSHFPNGVGQYFDEAYAMIIGCGFKEMVTFNQRKMTLRKISKRL